MRISNNQKGMTKYILGLFLTATMPLSLSVSSSSAMATSDLAQSMMMNTLPLSYSATINSKEDEEQKVPTITLSEEGKISTYNLGHALHDFQKVLVVKENTVFLNDLLQHFRAEDPTVSQDIAADMAAQMIYQWFRFTIELVGNRTADRNLDSLALNWKAVSRGYDVTVTSLAYQNIFKKLLVDQAGELEQATDTCHTQNADLDQESLVTESQLETAHKEKIESLERRKAKTTASIEQLDKNFKEIEKPTVSDEQEYQKSRKTFEDTIKSLTNDIDVAQSTFAKEKKEREEELARKKAENELVIKTLEAKHITDRASFIEDFSFIFEDLGNSWGIKTIGRLWKGKPTNREDYDYISLDKQLIENPDLLANAKNLMLSKILAVSEKMKSTPLVFDESEILEALLKRFGITYQLLTISDVGTIPVEVKTTTGTTLGTPPVTLMISTIFDETMQQQVPSPSISTPGTPPNSVVVTPTGKAAAKKKSNLQQERQEEIASLPVDSLLDSSAEISISPEEISHSASSNDVSNPLQIISPEPHRLINPRLFSFTNRSLYGVYFSGAINGVGNNVFRRGDLWSFARGINTDWISKELSKKPNE